MATEIVDSNIEDDLGTQVAAVAAAGGELEIRGGGSKTFYGEAIEALPLEVGLHSGVIDYDPAELVITLRAGCRLRDVETLLAEHRQMLGFEPPCFGEEATIGGTVASGLAGPRRAYAGAVRDFVLGVKIIDGRGDIQRFGGRVIKNVAGFDVARLMVGSLGTLGVILEISLRVIPMFESELTLAFEHSDAAGHIRWINQLGGQPLPLSASLWLDGVSHIRLSGSEQGVEQAAAGLGGERADPCWRAVNDQTHDFFSGNEPISRASLPPASDDLSSGHAQLIEWGGAERWLRGEIDVTGLRAGLEAGGGNLCAFRRHAPGTPVFHPLSAEMLKLQRSIKSSFDPAGIFNPGRIYPEL